MAKLDALELPGIPKRQDCLAWSEDGELAIATGDQVFILSPKRSSIGSDPNESPWHRTQFTAGAFLQSEWPIVDLEDMLNMRGAFIGREQAAAEVVAMEWSPSGVAKDFRCALAVLTTNYLVSLWTADSDSSSSTKWTRRCVFNAYINKTIPPIVAMSWSPIVDTNKLRKNRDTVPPHRAPIAWKYYLAVVLQDMTLEIMKLTSPQRTQPMGTISICASATFPESPATTNKDHQSCYTSIVHPEAALLGTSLHGVCWSPWKYSSESPIAQSTVVARAYNGNIRLSVTAGTEGKIEVGQPTDLKEAVDIRNANGTDSIWNGPCMVSALKCGPEDQEKTERICLATQEYSLECYQSIFERRGRVTTQRWKPCVGKSGLDEQVNKLKQEYSEKLRLRGPVDVRVWGLASYGQYLALCVTFHPAHLLQYITPGKSTFRVLFSHSSMEAGGSIDSTLDAPAPPFLRKRSETGEKNDFEAHLGPLPRCIPPQAKELSSVRMNAQLTLTILISACLYQNPQISWAAHIDTVISAYASSMASIPGIGELLAAIQTAKSNGTEALDRTALTKLVNEYITARASLEASGTSPRMMEYCSTPGCGGPIFWSPSLGASCTAGHRHTRCSLTALAMLNPYTIKRCSACTRPYLDETRLEAFYDDAVVAGAITAQQRDAPLSGGEHEREEDEQEQDAVAWLLSAICCIYCGGKFTRYV